MTTDDCRANGSCPNCGGAILGDGYTSPYVCESATEEDYEFKEPDARPTYCRITPPEPDKICFDCGALERENPCTLLVTCSMCGSWLCRIWARCRDNHDEMGNCPSPSYRLLAQGEQIVVGDEAWTWVDDCTRVGWLRLEGGRLGKIDDGHVPVRRKLVHPPRKTS